MVNQFRNLQCFSNHSIRIINMIITSFCLNFLLSAENLVILHDFYVYNKIYHNEYFI